jgi:hypothetical protein
MWTMATSVCVAVYDVNGVEMGHLCSRGDAVGMGYPWAN